MKEDRVGARLELRITYTLTIFELGTINILKKLKSPAGTLDPVVIMAGVFNSETNVPIIDFVPKPLAEFIFRRNLEHIPSVCSTPVHLDADAGATAKEHPYE